MTTTATTNDAVSIDAAKKAVADRIRAGRNFLITSHRNPDGDALGRDSDSHAGCADRMTF